MFLETLLECGAEGLQHTKSITVFMQYDRLREPSYSHKDDDGLYLDTEGNWEETTDELGQKHYQPRVLNTLMRLLINRIPIGQLETFRWCHTTRISVNTVELVARRHGRSLKSLKIYNAPDCIRPYWSTFSALTSFDAGHISPYTRSPWAAKVVALSCKSLRHVKLGCERDIALLYSNWNARDAAEASDFTMDFAADLRRYLPEATAETQKSLLSVESLHLVGIDCSFSPPIGEPTMVDIDKPTSLCLESCFNLGQSFPALNPLRNPDAPPLLPQLRSFRLRQEDSDESFQDGLKGFLLTIRGLVHLAVLLEGSGSFLSPDCFVGNHGSTLRTLVWDQRQRPRKFFHESTDTATPFMMSSFLAVIVEECPNLRELGIAMNLPSEYDPKNKDDEDDEDYVFRPHCINQLEKLKTLNIRILPAQKADTKISSIPKIHAGIATEIAHGLLLFSPGLETLGLGSTTWMDIWQGRSREIHSDPVEAYLCPRIFYIGYTVNLRGECQPLVTQIAQGTATEAKEYSSNLRIFEPYWLG